VPLVLAMIGGGALIGLVGYMDDRGHVPSGWRLLVHFSGAAWVFFLSGSMPRLSLGGMLLDLGWLGYLLGALYVVWVLNLYNFMDGIDGIAGIEAVLVSLGMALLMVVTDNPAAMISACLGVAALGFLPWNFPRARIFMGDAGSGFVGFSLAALAMLSAKEDPGLLWAWTILLGTFVVDATVTLFRRVLRGHRFDEAHRSHAYQYLARRLGAHVPVSLAYGGVTTLWLFPWAALVALGHLDGATALLIAYLPLVLAALWFKAGAPELQEV
jgi:Fuc2NAc and GlcNAc transferase